jgi:hypothetical protein
VSKAAWYDSNHSSPSSADIENTFRYTSIPPYVFMVKVKIKLSLYRPLRPLGLQEVEAPTFSDIRFTDGGEVVSPTRRQPITPRKVPGTNFS